MVEDERKDMARKPTTADSLAEDLGQLDLNLDGAADTPPTETHDTAEATTQTRYNLRSRNKFGTTNKAKDPQPAYIPPHMRGKDTGKATSKTTTEPTPIDDSRPRTRRTAGKKKSMSAAHAHLTSSRLRAMILSRTRI